MHVIAVTAANWNTNNLTETIRQRAPRLTKVHCISKKIAPTVYWLNSNNIIKKGETAAVSYSGSQ
jgi:hypothetical protein